MHYSAKSGIEIACRQSARLSVRLSVCNVVDQDRIGCKSWKLIARTFSPTSSLFVAQRPSTRGTWGNFGETSDRVGKVECWSTKAPEISLKRAKIDEKLQWRAYRKSLTLFRTVPPLTPDGLPFSKIGVRNPNPKMQSLLRYLRNG